MKIIRPYLASFFSRTLCCLAGFIIVLSGLPRNLNAAAVGLSQGKLSAQPSGGVGYEMPIVVAPGTAGIQPKLAFQYSSGGRNGALGMGWSVSGVSAISRAPQTIAQDGVVRGVDFTLNDRYSMDGQRLIVISGLDGAAGSEYRTELNSFVKVVANGQSGQGPATFTAWTKSGLIYTFGGANGASYVPAGKTEVLTWLLSRVQDQAGNYMTFQYSSEGNLSSVNYTMNDSAGLGSYASVVFTYDATRPDPAIGYVVGSSISLNQRLARVTSYYGQQIVRQYDLAYEISANTAKSRLTSITEGTGVETFSPTRFTWDNTPDSQNYGGYLGQSGGNVNLQGDFNADGKCDVAVVQTTKLEAFKIENRWMVSIGSATVSGYAGDDTWQQGDFNGDGKVDVMRIYGPNNTPVKMTLYTNTGNGGAGTAFTVSTPALQGTAVTFQPQQSFIAMDANGDGKLDIVNVSGIKNDGSSQALTFSVYLNNPNGNQPNTFVKQTWAISRVPGDLGGTQADYAHQYDQWFAGDFNGDGLPDLAQLWKDNNKQSVRVYLNKNGSFQSAQWINQSKSFFQTGNTTRAYHWLLGDFNGDGLADLIRVPKTFNPDASTTADVFLSSGSVSTKFASPQAWMTLLVPGETDYSVPTPELHCGDFNGDGRSDLVTLQDFIENLGEDGAQGPYQTTTWRDYYLSNGVATAGFAHEHIENDPVVGRRSFNPAKALAADFNGDGKEDLIRQSSSLGIMLEIYNSSGGFNDLLRVVTDGMGASASIDYQPLTGVNGVSVFTPSTDAIAPAIDLTIPMPVVASITYDNGLGAVGSAGSTYSVSYRYEGLKADPKRGMLGFRSVEAIDNRPVDNPDPSLPPSGTPNGSTALHTKSWFKKGFPYTGMAERAVSYLAAPGTTKSFTDNSGLLSRTETIYAAGPTENTRVYFPYAQDSHVYSYDLNGAATNDTETIAPQMDAYGNTLSSVVKTKDLPSSNFFSKTTNSTYNVSTSNWRIGQVTGSSVLSQAPGQPNVTRASGFSYNSSNGQVGSETVEPSDPSWVKTDYEYDAFGNTKKSTTSGGDIANRITTTNYDAKGRFVATTVNALGHTETKSYDERFGAVTNVTGPNGLSDTAQYDGFSRKISSARADGTSTATSYEWSSGANAPANAVYLVRVTPQDGPETITYFDRLGREMRRQSIAGDGRTILLDTTYDYRGRKQTATKPYFVGDTPIFATTIYDAVDRVRQVIAPSVDETGTSVLTYLTNHYNGLVTTSTNPKGQQTITTKDAAGHLRQVQDALTGTISYTYDALGQLTRTTDASGNSTIITYDVRGRKTSVDDPDLGLWTYTYYSTGELKTQTDAKNQTVSFQYDQLGRVTQRTDPTTDVTAWTYDTATGKGIGKLKSVVFTPATGSLLSPYSNTITYDNLGRPSSQSTLISGTTYTTATTYGQFSRPDTLTYPTGFSVKQFYGANGYLTDIKKSDSSTTYWTARGYDADGHITQEKYGNNIVTDRVYLPENGLLKEIHSGLGGGTGVQDFEYNFDVIGNLMKRTDRKQTIGGNTLTETFTYDNLNRVKTAQVTGQSAKNFSYNIIGNITSKDGAGAYDYTPAPGSLQPNERPHPHAVRKVNGGPNIAYDMNGNMTSGLGRTLAWTWFNMPQRIQMNGGASSDFTYDPDHNRITQRTAGQNGLVETKYIGGIYEKVSEGNYGYRKHYINSPTGRVAVFTEKIQEISFGNDPPVGTIVSSDTKYFHKDHLGSVDTITNESGAVIERDSFDAWGSRRTTDWQGQMSSSYRSIVSRGFTDHEQLDDFGLVHMNGRVYDPLVGRFLSADPFVQAPTVTQNFNRYSYVLNNPLSLIDPTGFNFLGDFGKWLGDVFGSTVGGIIKAVISYVAYVVVFAVIAQYAGPVVAAVGAGFVSGFLSTSLSGASLGQALQSGAIFAGIAGLTQGLNRVLPDGGTSLIGREISRVAHAAIVGGLWAGASAIQNSSIRDGFVGAFVSALLSPSMNGVGGGGIEGIALRVAAAAVAGGTAAELTGGKFANGAITAGFVRLFQEEIRFGSQVGTKNAGSATSSGFNALTVVGDFIGKIWNIPNNIIGIGVAIFSGAHFAGFANNAMQFTGGHFFSGWINAITIGNVQIYNAGYTPDSYGPSPYTRGLFFWLGFHEQAHTYQSQILGPLFIPVYYASKLFGNPFETAADQWAALYQPPPPFGR